MTVEPIEPWVCDQCGSDMIVHRDSEFGPVTIWRCECGACGHRVRVSVERVIARSECDTQCDTDAERGGITPSDG